MLRLAPPPLPYTTLFRSYLGIEIDEVPSVRQVLADHLGAYQPVAEQRGPHHLLELHPERRLLLRLLEQHLVGHGLLHDLLGSPRSEEHTSELQSPDHLVC